MFKWIRVVTILNELGVQNLKTGEIFDLSHNQVQNQGECIVNPPKRPSCIE